MTSTVILRERWLPWAQAGVAFHVLLSVILFFVGTAVFYNQLTTVCITNCHDLQLQPAEVQTLARTGLTIEQYAVYQVAQEYLYLVAFLITGSIIYIKLVRDRDPLAWFGLLATFALVSVGTILLPETTQTIVSLGAGWEFLYELLKATSNTAFLAFCLLFPNGRFVPSWTRWPLAIVIIWMAAWVILPLPALDPAREIGIFPSLTMLGFIVITQIHRYRRVATPIQRQQTKWFVFGFGIIFSAVVLWSTLFINLPIPTGPSRVAANLIGQGILALFPLAVAACMCISLVRYRLWDIDIIINRTLVYTGLTIIIILVYVLIVGGLGSILQTQGNLVISLLATGFIAVLFQPLRHWLQSNVNRLMFGERDNPYGVLSKLGTQLQTVSTPEAMLQSVVETIAATLKLPYVAIDLTDNQGSLGGATTGAAVTETAEFPLRYQNELVGCLVVSPRSQGEPFTEPEQKLLADIAGQTGTMAYSVRLTAALQRSRENLVLAREEERRRIRRDLHDGLGPTLASQTFALDAAIDLLTIDPQGATRLLQAIKTQNQETVADIRRLVYELRPPTLDELGLLDALKAHITKIEGESTPIIQISANPDPLPTLSAAVEVAAYRMVLEAVTNVIRHAQARHCEVELAVASSNGRPHLHIQVSDDGIGLFPNLRPGVGLTSMRERADELGGLFEAASGKDGKTRVTAVLPINTNQF